MSDIKARERTERRTSDLVLEFELDAPVEKVWRAISIPAFREKWLPKSSLADAEPVSSTPGEEIRYGMRETEPPFLDSVVTFQLRPNETGGTRLRIVHGLKDVRQLRRPRSAANSNGSCRMRAA
ncbi:MAG: polyketide cyclase [Kaistia sp. SCN 65-12]|nr:MAG: polyketide cyclase [Kaistia sp. SCN 65-12]